MAEDGWSVAKAKPRKNNATKRDARGRGGAGDDRRSGGGRGRGRGRGGSYGGRGRGDGGRSRDRRDDRARDSRKPQAQSREYHAERSADEPLGGVIFHCNNETIEENMERMVFGLVTRKTELVERITPGMPVFLFNYSIKELHGGFIAGGNGQLNICPEAWVSAHVSNGKPKARRGKPGQPVRSVDLSLVSLQRRACNLRFCRSESRDRARAFSPKPFTRTHSLPLFPFVPHPRIIIPPPPPPPS